MNRIIIFLALVSIIGCSEKEVLNNSDNNTDINTDINMVTGINLIDSAGVEIGKLGNPNELNKINFDLYPNPTVNFLNLYPKGSVSGVWIRPAEPSKDYLQTDFEAILNSGLYSENEIETNIKLKLKLTNSDSPEIRINVGSLGIGYYRVFVKVDGVIFWRNIYVGTSTSELDNLEKDWN